MKLNPIGGTGIEISEISLGTWAVGNGYFGIVPEKDTLEAIRSSVDSGINFIDTAYIYGAGYSEQLLGKAVKGIRDKLVISTKAWTDKFRKKDLIEACEASLQRLGTDYIDMYFLHYFVPEVPLEETMGAMADLKAQGKIRAVGVSNFSLEQIQKADSLTPVRCIPALLQYSMEIYRKGCYPLLHKQKYRDSCLQPAGARIIDREILKRVGPRGWEVPHTLIQ